MMNIWSHGFKCSTRDELRTAIRKLHGSGGTYLNALASRRCMMLDMSKTNAEAGVARDVGPGRHEQERRHNVRTWSMAVQHKRAENTCPRDGGVQDTLRIDPADSAKLAEAITAAAGKTSKCAPGEKEHATCNYRPPVH